MAANTSSTRATTTRATDQPLTPYRGPTGARAAATTYQSLALCGWRWRRWKASGRSPTELDPSGCRPG